MSRSLGQMGQTGLSGYRLRLILTTLHAGPACTNSKFVECRAMSRVPRAKRPDGKLNGADHQDSGVELGVHPVAPLAVQ